MTTILVDDELFGLEELEYFLNQHKDVNILGKYCNPCMAIERIKKDNPNVVFLDIGMPEIDGFNIAEEILSFNSDIKIIFVTAHDEFAVRAFKINALDYILKPIDKERIDETVLRIRKACIGNNQQRESIQQQALKKNLRKVPLWKDESIFLVSAPEIIYCKSCDKEVSFVTIKDSCLKSTNSLNYWENRLREQRFFRSHKSFLVNMDKVEEIIPTIGTTYSLRLKGSNDEVPLSRNNYQVLKKILEF